MSQHMNGEINFVSLDTSIKWYLCQLIQVTLDIQIMIWGQVTDVTDETCQKPTFPQVKHRQSEQKLWVVRYNN